jgi:hypothetical protein
VIDVADGADVNVGLGALVGSEEAGLRGYRAEEAGAGEVAGDGGLGIAGVGGGGVLAKMGEGAL